MISKVNLKLSQKSQYNKQSAFEIITSGQHHDKQSEFEISTQSQYNMQSEFEIIT